MTWLAASQPAAAATERRCNEPDKEGDSSSAETTFCHNWGVMNDGKVCLQVNNKNIYNDDGYRESLKQ